MGETASDPKASATAYPHLLSPLQIGPREVRNRVLVTAHVPRLADNGVPGERYIAYHKARARGGAGLQITGATPVHRTSSRGAGNALENVDDAIIPGYRKLADTVHAEGARILAQLAHFGATISGSEADLPLWSPSDEASDLGRTTPHVMTKAEIAEVVDAFGEAARRAAAGDMDGIEILGAFGLLIAAFLSPYSNKREDEYGGSLENRMRFALEVTDAVRSAVGSDRIVGMRIPGDEFVDGGLDQVAMGEIAEKLAATGKLDYLNVIAGNNLDRIHRATHWPPTPAPHGLFVPLAAAIKARVDLPVFTTGRIVDPAMAEDIVASGKADMVGMTRAHIADPDIVAKIRTGRREDIRPCVGANVCIAQAMKGGPLRCIHNPEAAREHDWGPAPAIIGKAKAVAVIGGGPAGLEAARVAAERGHRATLYEADTHLGGQFALRASIPNWTEFQSVIDWRRGQLEKLQVPVHLGHRIEAADLQDMEADAVILATGAVPRLPEISGATGAWLEVATPHAVVRDGRPDARHAIVWDRHGGVIGAGVTESLAAAGVRVTVVTPAFAAHEDIDLIQRVPLYERLLSAGARFLPNFEIDRVDGRRVICRNVYTFGEEVVEEVDLLVAWTGSTAADGLRAAVEASGRRLHLAGDCSAPRTADIAIAEGALAARRL